MSYSEVTMAEFVALLEKQTPQEGPHLTSIPDVVTLRQTKPFEYEKKVMVYEPALFILGKGEKQLFLDGEKYDYSAGRFLCLFLPIPVQVKATEATPDNPLLMMGIKINLIKFANILLKMDKVQSLPAKSEAINTSAIFSEPLNQELLDSIVRLLRILDNPLEREVLGESILEEIYFRLICQDKSGSLQRLLQHRGQVQQISKVVDYIHQNLDEVISIDELAGIVNMSTSGFRKTFKEVMHMPPLQYAKSIKLDRAYTLIKKGKNASEAGYLVGYNSPAQFSREYKRHFGFAPSAT
jgi:AraC-like DNA-binding protein